MDQNKLMANTKMLEECFKKFDLEIVNKKNQTVTGINHTEFSSSIFVNGAGQQTFNAKYYHELNMIEVCFYLKLDFESRLREAIAHLLNLINSLRNDSFWAICSCCNEIEMRYATMIKDVISKSYLERMFKKSLFLAKTFTPLILHLIASKDDPYQLSKEFFLNNRYLAMRRIIAKYDEKNPNVVYIDEMALD